MLIALSRQVSSSINDCELTHLTREHIDLKLARYQHHNYIKTLLNAGCTVINLPEEPTLPDAVFVEDIVFVLDELAVLTRPGAASRRAESSSVAAALASFREVHTIKSPATLDGGDILQIGRSIFVGIATRSNQAAVAQLQDLLCEFGYRVIGIPVTGCLHLKSAVSQVGENLLLMNPHWVDQNLFSDYEVIHVSIEEPYAANAVYVNGKVIYPISFPRTQQLLIRQGIYPELVDVSELQKAEGAVTCCSVIFTVQDQEVEKWL